MNTLRFTTKNSSDGVVERDFTVGTGPRGALVTRIRR
jgi:hypothetical protein